MAWSRERLRKATFNLPEAVLVSLDQLVQEGVAPSKNAFVERAIVQELDRLRRAERALLWEQASQDPLFLKDLEEIEVAFGAADTESLPGLG